jgi:hypothetical protein
MAYRRQSRYRLAGGRKIIAKVMATWKQATRKGDLQKVDLPPTG